MEPTQYEREASELRAKCLAHLDAKRTRYPILSWQTRLCYALQWMCFAPLALVCLFLHVLLYILICLHVTTARSWACEANWTALSFALRRMPNWVDADGGAAGSVRYYLHRMSYMELRKWAMRHGVHEYDYDC